jgi:hypothetical protein
LRRRCREIVEKKLGKVLEYPLSPASPLERELVSNGPLPLPLCGGAQAPGRVSLPPTQTEYKNIAILLIIKGIAIAFVNLFDYICVALK